MPKVKLLVSICGGHNKAPGEEHECSAAEAKRLIAAGMAEVIASPIERAVKKVPAIRTATAPKAKAEGAVSRAAKRVKAAITGSNQH